jgi:hypothetical protein
LKILIHLIISEGMQLTALVAVALHVQSLFQKNTIFEIYVMTLYFVPGLDRLRMERRLLWLRTGLDDCKLCEVASGR